MCSLRCPVLLENNVSGRQENDWVSNLWVFSPCGFPTDLGTQCFQPYEFEIMGPLSNPRCMGSCIFLFPFFFLSGSSKIALQLKLEVLHLCMFCSTLRVLWLWPLFLKGPSSQIKMCSSASVCLSLLPFLPFFFFLSLLPVPLGDGCQTMQYAHEFSRVKRANQFHGHDCTRGYKSTRMVKISST